MFAFAKIFHFLSFTIISIIAVSDNTNQIKTAPKLTLNNDREIPAIGLGTYLIENVEEVIEQSIINGCRLIDTAYIYGNEEQIGKALASVFQKEIVKREDIFVISKLWNSQHDPEDVRPAIEESLGKLQLDYVDLYLIHWPMAMKPKKEISLKTIDKELDIPFEETWAAMEDLVKQGLAKSIGISNFNNEQIDRILKVAEIQPVINQVECNPFLNQEKLNSFCKERDILLMCYSPFCRRHRRGVKDYGVDLFEEPIIKELSHKYNKTVGQIILRYLTQLGTIPIPKSESVKRVKENIEIFDFSIDFLDMRKMKSLNQNARSFTMDIYRPFKEYPFAIEY